MSGALNTKGQTQTLPDRTSLSLLDGGVMRRALEAIQARLQEVFPRGEGQGRFVHALVPPVMSPAAWDRLIDHVPFVGLGWVSWGSKSVARPYRGDLQFALFLITRNPRTDWLLIGDVASPGLFAMVGCALAALQMFKIPGVGTVEVGEAGGVWSEDWVRDDQATAALRLTIPGVQLDDPIAAASLPDFKTLGERWTFSNNPAGEGFTGELDIGSS